MKDYCPPNLCHNIPLTSLYIRDKGKQTDRQTWNLLSYCHLLSAIVLVRTMVLTGTLGRFANPELPSMTLLLLLLLLWLRFRGIVCLEWLVWTNDERLVGCCCWCCGPGWTPCWGQDTSSTSLRRPLISRSSAVLRNPCSSCWGTNTSPV